jgi:hypothetical protein
MQNRDSLGSLIASFKVGRVGLASNACINAYTPYGTVQARVYLRKFVVRYF